MTKKEVISSRKSSRRLFRSHTVTYEVSQQYLEKNNEEISSKYLPHFPL